MQVAGVSVEGEVFIELDPEGGAFWIRAPYNDEFIRDLKLRIPRMHRAWLPRKRKWSVSRSHWDSARRLITERFEIIRYSPAAVQAENEMLEDMIGEPALDAHWQLGIRTDAEDELVHVAMLINQWKREIGIDVPDLTDAYRLVCVHRGISTINKGWLRAYGVSFVSFVNAWAWRVLNSKPAFLDDEDDDNEDV